MGMLQQNLFEKSAPDLWWVREVFGQGSLPVGTFLCSGSRLSREILGKSGVSDGRDRIYYFSPKAAEIAIAGNLFRGFNASICSKKPNLEGYRKIVFELPT